MATTVKTELKAKAVFDPVRCRKYFNDQLTVLHCHHFTALYTQLADDVDFIDGKKLLQEVSEDSFLKILKDYCCKYDITEISDMVEIGQQYFAAIGLGTLTVKFAGEFSGKVKMHSSHVDEGWIKKWGKRDKPVNFIGAGYIAALFCLLFDMPKGSFDVFEEQSIVAGASFSVFKVVKK